MLAMTVKLSKNEVELLEEYRLIYAEKTCIIEEALEQNKKGNYTYEKTVCQKGRGLHGVSGVRPRLLHLLL